jgi:hypothetical protein
MIKKGDLYYLLIFPRTKALVTEIYNKRKFHQTQSHFNDFPSISIVPHVKVVIVSGSYKGEKEDYTTSDFNTYFRKIEVENEVR